MKVLGLSSNYHDASSALVIDGAVVAAAAEERFTLQKHDPSFPFLSAMFCLDEAGIHADDLDIIAYHEEPEVKFSRSLCSSYQNYPFSRKTFVKSMHEAISSGFWIKNEISKKLDIDPRKVIYVPHHFSHAAHGFFGSPFDNAAVMTLDAAGEWMCSGIFNGESSQGNISLQPVDLSPFPHSLGLVYSAFTGFLGFKVNDGECSTMALSAFGEPRYVEAIRKIIIPQSDGSYEIDVSYFDFSQSDNLPITKLFVSLFGEPRSYKEKLPFDCLLARSAHKNVSPEVQRYADIAASIQFVLEEAVISMAKRAARLTQKNNLCLSGGVALNCVANGKLVREKIFDNIFVPPDPGDGGGAMGAALFAHYAATNSRPPFQMHPYFGKSYDDKEVKDILSVWRKSAFKVQSFSEEDSMISYIAEKLAKQKIVGWVQGHFENGPRALGNRSILCDPSNVDVAKRLSTKVKMRAPFRPYACSLTEEYSKKVFGFDQIPLTARWMQMSAPVVEAYASTLRGAMHVDGTTRPQVCGKDGNSIYWKLLKAFGAKTGAEALLNTSFNGAGYPMVSSPTEALLMFTKTDMDILVVNNTVIEKEA